MISASKNTISLKNLKILRGKVTKYLKFDLKSFENMAPENDEKNLLKTSV
jgi:hypothetical protein